MSLILKAVAVFIKDVVLYDVGETENCQGSVSKVSPLPSLCFCNLLSCNIFGSPALVVSVLDQCYNAHYLDVGLKQRTREIL